MNQLKGLATFLIVFFCTSIIQSVYAIAIPAKSDRIGWSADGNRHDPDDWGASAMALSIFAKAGWQNKLVHIDYNNCLPENTPFKAEEERISMVEGVQKFGFTNTKLFDCQTDLEKAVNHVVEEIISTNISAEPTRCVSVGVSSILRFVVLV